MGNVNYYQVTQPKRKIIIGLDENDNFCQIDWSDLVSDRILLREDLTKILLKSLWKSLKIILKMRCF